jgi:hypothetical protein
MKAASVRSQPTALVPVLAPPESVLAVHIADDKDIGADGQKAGFKAEKGGVYLEHSKPERY